MPNRFESIIEPHKEPSKSRYATRAYYAGVGLLAAAALYFGVFGGTTDKAARQTVFDTCVSLNKARVVNNREVKIPLRNFGRKQAQATAALVKFLDANQNPRATATQKAAFAKFTDLFRQQAAAAAELNDITIPKPTPCKRL